MVTPTDGFARGLVAEFAPLRNYSALREDWLSLEQLADSTFFATWAWAGSWISLLPVDERPLVCRISSADRLVALAVFGTRRRWRLALPFRQLLLNASGSEARDSIHIEMNQLLAIRGCELAAWRALLKALLHSDRQQRCDELLLAGLAAGASVSEVAAECGLATHSTERSAPYVDLERVRTAGEYSTLLRTKGRYGIRRALRDYRRTLGEPTLVRAGTAVQAEEFLRGLAEFHQLRWTAKGQRGAFATPAFRKFHETLIREHFAHGCLDLFRVQCAATIIAFIYAFRYRDVAYFYQCGFNYRALPAHNQPGYVALPLVIKHYAASGALTFEFLAGDEDYKKRLATHSRALVWLEVQRPGVRTALLRCYRALRNKVLTAAQPR